MFSNQKETELFRKIFFCVTYNLRSISFKIILSTIDIMLLSSFTFLTVILKDIGIISFCLFYLLKLMTFQGGFQLWEQKMLEGIKLECKVTWKQEFSYLLQKVHLFFSLKQYIISRVLKLQTFKIFLFKIHFKITDFYLFLHFIVIILRCSNYLHEAVRLFFCLSIYTVDKHTKNSCR